MSQTVAVTDSDFEEKVIKSKDPVLVDFWAPWCAPCMSVAPTLDELSNEYSGKVLIAKMNVDENANIPVNYGVRSIPYMALFKDGQIVDSIVGAVPKDQLVKMLDKTIAS
ncbi:MAG: thioredoxin [Zetaproteobacteria bacterium]|nr:thioredoxin [Pseudobdellovibrionaceae bacterium]|tara:strand:- start:58 stop:387 length:330 start_codon:yes stop_codon:yes gene_type:complete